MKFICRNVQLILIAILPLYCHADDEPTTLDKISQKALHLSTGAAFGSASLVTRFAWVVCQISPWSIKSGKECLLLSDTCNSIAKRAFSQLFLDPAVSSSHASWHLNKAALSQIQPLSKEEEKLLHFLERRWLAKGNGFYASMTNWVCPFYGTHMQVHPESTNCYSRNPSTKSSQTYKNRVESWKAALPHPHHFPLILTRPSRLDDYLPSYLSISQRDEIEEGVKKTALKQGYAVLDVTPLANTWDSHRFYFFKACKKHHVNPADLICVQRLEQQGIGGLRLLALEENDLDAQHSFLLEWIGTLGLSATRVELDRCPANMGTTNTSSCTSSSLSREDFLSQLLSIEKHPHPQKALMLESTLQLLIGLITNLTEENWSEVIESPTLCAIAALSFEQIKEQLSLLSVKKEASFFEWCAHIDQIHSSLSSLLEILDPFKEKDFPKIYAEALTTLPDKLHSLTSYGIHASGMTSLTGIFKAVERSIGTEPRAIYGENSYYENIALAHLTSKAVSAEEASEEDWREADLLIAQFNPVLKRSDVKATGYRLEKVAENLHRALHGGRHKPLTVALDGTLDGINSWRATELFKEFEEEIATGALNVICYRSGIKFDMLGMDLYCGAPFYMIHNHDPKWKAFDLLLTDPVLQTDHLSLNWFCLAYKHGIESLELYQQQISLNTRELLKRIPSRLLEDKKTSYRVTAFDQESDPGFIDLKIYGALHKVRGSVLGAGTLYSTCMEANHPIFTRSSLGFYHPNFFVLFDEESTTIRLTVGLDPDQIEVLSHFFEKIDALNE